MKSKVLAAAAAAAFLVAGAAQAAVTYAFSSTYFAFEYVSPDYVTGPLAVDLTGNPSCVGLGRTCSAAFFPPDLAGNPADTLSFTVAEPAGFTQIGYFYFPTGAFSTPGTYQDAFFDRESWLFAGGTLTVSGRPDPGGVPEPGAWVLMIAGFGLAGHALRRRSVRRPA
ncbi:PEPxxWA-CTERM sorting domain-containing protein [Phenylobacterium sp.]|uniref:PEPxxWA-CTERM sorting domain-containing protein n=1 Tax=Phenylobacterium sp. TaxID=1871053 RepID=UPI00301DF9BC